MAGINENRSAYICALIFFIDEYSARRVTYLCAMRRNHGFIHARDRRYLACVPVNVCVHICVTMHASVPISCLASAVQTACTSCSKSLATPFCRDRTLDRTERNNIVDETYRSRIVCEPRVDPLARNYGVEKKAPSSRLNASRQDCTTSRDIAGI